MPGAIDPEPPSGRGAQDFLFHLYRGSELLQDDAVDLAKGELEAALRLQPRDAHSQALLGIVYFRLGLYPRAIELFTDVERLFPAELPLKVNLALCYLKTGQTHEARVQLEDVVSRDPEHRRAWGYLGLIFQRDQAHAKAAAAFERAGHGALAARARSLASRDVERPSFAPPAARPLAPEAQVVLPPPSRLPELNVSPRAPTHSMPSLTTLDVPETLADDAFTVTELAEQIALDLPASGVHATASGLVVVISAGAFNARRKRVTAVRATATPMTTEPLLRKSRAEAPEPLGGLAAPIVRFTGSGQIILAPERGHRLTLLPLGGAPLFLREGVIVGFEGAVTYQNGHVVLATGERVPLMQLTGTGVVVVTTRHALVSLEVNESGPCEVAGDHLVGWTGRLLPRGAPAPEANAGVPSAVRLSGRGFVLLDPE